MFMLWRRVERLLYSLALDWEVHPVSEVTNDWFAVASPTVLLTSLLAYFAIVGCGCATLKNVPKDPNTKDPFWMKSLGRATSYRPRPFITSASRSPRDFLFKQTTACAFCTCYSLLNFPNPR